MITGWELALILFAMTFMIVNVVNVVVQLKVLSIFVVISFTDVFFKSKRLNSSIFESNSIVFSLFNGFFGDIKSLLCFHFHLSISIIS